MNRRHFAGLIAIAATTGAGHRNSGTAQTGTTPWFYDDFQRPDGLGLGASPQGYIWEVVGDGSTSAQIQSGTYIANGNAYAWIDRGWPTTGMSMTISWDAGSTGTATLISSPEESLLEHMVHMYVTRQGWAFQIRDHGGEFINLVGGPLNLPDQGVPCTAGFELRGNQLAIWAPDGSYLELDDARLPGLMGRYCTWQNLLTDGSPFMRIHDVRAWESSP